VRVSRGDYNKLTYLLTYSLICNFGIIATPIEFHVRSNDHERLLIQHSRGAKLFDVECMKNSTRERHSYNRILIGTVYSVVISNGLE